MSFRRFTLTDPGGLVQRFGLRGDADRRLLPTRARYNVAPMQGVAVLVDDGEGRRHFLPMRWGFQPVWVTEDPRRPAPATARAETLATNALFRDAFERRRAIVPADGFYVWQRVRGAAEPRPFLFRRADGGLFGFAAIFSGDRRKPDEHGGTCAIVTTPANALLGGPRGRMPAILPCEGEALWLDPRVRAVDVLRMLLRPYPDGLLVAQRVSPRVESPLADDAALIEPV